MGCGQVINGGSNGQGEGGQCTFVPNEQNNNAVNGTDECQAGLFCYPGQQFADCSQGVTFDRCCPPVLSPTDPIAACRSSSNVTGGNPTAGADASFGVTSVDSGDSPADGEAGSTDLDATLPPLDAALASLDAAPPGLAGFALLVNDVVQHPMSCPGSDWEFAPYPGVKSVLLVNTSALPLAYVAGLLWNDGGGYVPGVMPNVELVPSGGMYLAGVLAPGGTVDITSVFAGGIVAFVGSAEPFSAPDAGDINDEGTIPWPSGVVGNGGATTMYVAEIDVFRSCELPSKLW
jgi:hypothetical protein